MQGKGLLSHRYKVEREWAKLHPPQYSLVEAKLVVILVSDYFQAAWIGLWRRHEADTEDVEEETAI